MLEKLQAQLKMERKLYTGLKEILKDHEKFEQLVDLDRLPFSEIPIYKHEIENGRIRRTEPIMFGDQQVTAFLYQPDHAMGSISPIVKLGNYGIKLVDKDYRMELVDSEDYLLFDEGFEKELNSAYKIIRENHEFLPTEMYRCERNSGLDFLKTNRNGDPILKDETIDHFVNLGVTGEDIINSIDLYIQDRQLEQFMS